VITDVCKLLIFSISIRKIEAETAIFQVFKNDFGIKPEDFELVISGEYSCYSGIFKLIWTFKT
jgi:hypothetical protein